MISEKRKRKNLICAWIILALCAALFVGCADSQENASSSQADDDTLSERTVFAMDTIMTLRVYGADGEKVLDDAEEEITRLDDLLRRGETSSEIYKINSKGTAQVSDDTAELLKAALSISEATDGAFDISVAPVMDLWGFYGQQFHVPASEEIAAMLPNVDWHGISLDGNTVSLKEGVEIDLGGIAKGYLSSRRFSIL